MKYKIGDKVKVITKGLQLGDGVCCFIEISLPGRIATVNRILGCMYFLEEVPFPFPEECLEEVSCPIDSRFDILDL
jgi:hypothetical protein